MLATSMTLKVLLPYKVFAEKHDVLRIVAVTQEGAYGILPNRLDCATSLVSGILVFEIDKQGEFYIAVDEGVLVKTGKDIVVSVRNAIAGDNLTELRAQVEEEFFHLDEQEKMLRSVLAKMESHFIRRMASFNQETTLL